MRRNRPDLVVPVHDRRQRRRILTLKNFGWAMIVVVAIFAAITIEANLRGRKPGSDYGRLYGRQIESVNAVPAKPVVVQDAPISDQTAADPTLVDGMRREQILHAEQTNVAPTLSGPGMEPTESRPHVTSRDGKIAIVGGPEGVGIVQSDRRQPVLRGGFGR
jgi:hypothetical protein